MHDFYYTQSIQRSLSAGSADGRLKPGDLICMGHLGKEDIQTPCESLCFCSTQPGGNGPYQDREEEEKQVSEDVPGHIHMTTWKFSTQTLILKLLTETLGVSVVWYIRDLTNIYPKSQKHCWKFQHFLSPTGLYFFQNMTILLLCGLSLLVQHITQALQRTLRHNFEQTQLFSILNCEIHRCRQELVMC